MACIMVNTERLQIDPGQGGEGERRRVQRFTLPRTHLACPVIRRRLMLSCMSWSSFGLWRRLFLGVHATVDETKGWSRWAQDQGAASAGVLVASHRPHRLLANVVAGGGLLCCLSAFCEMPSDCTCIHFLQI
jgi:hypothetical protein